MDTTLDVHLKKNNRPISICCFNKIWW